MNGLLRRTAAALLCGFVSFLLTVPVACGGLLLYSEHLNGDVQSGGPESILGAMAFAAVFALLVAALVFIKTADRS